MVGEVLTPRADQRRSRLEDSPLFELSGKTLGAISVSSPLSRFDCSSIAKIKLLLQDVANTLTERLGRRV
jgi:hypothetical protein